MISENNSYKAQPVNFFLTENAAQPISLTFVSVKSSENRVALPKDHRFPCVVYREHTIVLSGMKDKGIHGKYNWLSSLSVFSEAIQICSCTLILISYPDSYADVLWARHALSPPRRSWGRKIA